MLRRSLRSLCAEGRDTARLQRRTQTETKYTGDYLAAAGVVVLLPTLVFLLFDDYLENVYYSWADAWAYEEHLAMVKERQGARDAGPASAAGA